MTGSPCPPAIPSKDESALAAVRCTTSDSAARQGRGEPATMLNDKRARRCLLCSRHPRRLLKNANLNHVFHNTHAMIAGTQGICVVQVAAPLVLGPLHGFVTAPTSRQGKHHIRNDASYRARKGKLKASHRQSPSRDLNSRFRPSPMGEDYHGSAHRERWNQA